MDDFENLILQLHLLMFKIQVFVTTPCWILHIHKEILLLATEKSYSLKSLWLWNKSQNGKEKQLNEKEKQNRAKLK